MQYTEKLNLKKPEYDDLVDIADINDNMDILDERISALEFQSKGLNELTWAEVSEISATGNAANYFSIGDRKAVQLSGTMGTLSLNTTLYASIIAFEHNADIEGSGITFGNFKTTQFGAEHPSAFVDSSYGSILADGTKLFNMNHSTKYTEGGWQGCNMRYDILGSVHSYNTKNATSTTVTNPVSNTLMSCLPSDLRAVLKPITKYSDNVGGVGDTTNSYGLETSVTATKDYLPLMAEYEVNGERFIANKYEQDYQKIYDYYLAGNPTLCRTIDDQNTYVSWLTRSLRTSTEYHWTVFDDDYDDPSISYTTTGSTSCGVSPVFLV